MKILTRNIFIIFFLIFFTSIPLFSKQFGPWERDVRIGDKNISCYINNKGVELKSKRKKDSSEKVLNGPQAGAFFLIRFFQICISPQDGPNCRFHPVCSLYARRAVERFGAFMGSIMAGERLIRCNPYYPPGNDFVPEKITGDY